MEKHKCKLCFKSFANGRALGGHMRSHMMNLPIQPKPHQQPIQLKEVEAESADSASASSSSSSEDEGEEKLLGYGLRENPKKSFRLVDPEFSFAIDGGSVSVVVQDRESETESSKNPTRRRSKRTRKLCNAERQCQQQEQETTKKVKFYKPINSKAESWAEPEPVSSISDATTEEDVAFCLMMLSRDKWMKDEEEGEEEEEEEEEKSMEEYLYEYEETKPCKTNRVKGKFYKCETCKKTFRSYQALGGHRASHKKIRLLENAAAAAGTATTIIATNNTPPASDKKIHECPVCFRVFSSGQALGGHKRSHAITDSAAAVATKNNSTKFGDNWIDLNLPAPMEDDEISQIELSAVSDGDFVNHIK